MLSRRWRLTKKLNPAQSEALVRLVEAQPDLTSDYLLEIERMERINKFRSGYRYPTWLREHPWSWSDAPDYLRAIPTTRAARR